MKCLLPDGLNSFTEDPNILSSSPRDWTHFGWINSVQKLLIYITVKPINPTILTQIIQQTFRSQDRPLSITPESKHNFPLSTTFELPSFLLPYFGRAQSEFMITIIALLNESRDSDLHSILKHYNSKTNRKLREPSSSMFEQRSFASDRAFSLSSSSSLGGSV